MLEQRFADVLMLAAASKAMQIEVLVNLTALLEVLPGRVPSNNHGRVQFADEANYVARACLVHKPGICATLCNKVKACWLCCICLLVQRAVFHASSKMFQTFELTAVANSELII